MELKSYLLEEINDSLDSLKRRMTEQKKAVKRIKFLDTEHAEYTVYLNSLWQDQGGKNIQTRHIGSLEDAIRTAEEVFKEQNSSQDIQAKYAVDITVGRQKYSVPENYWNKYTQRN